MSSTKMLVTGAFMAAIASSFQLIPVLLSEAAVLLTMFSALPIYIAARCKPVTGILSYLTAAILIMLFSTHESLFFLCTNGMVGLSLGICCYYTQKKLIILMISSLVMTISLSIMNYVIGFPVFGTTLPGTYTIQFILIFLFSFVYNTIYYYFAGFLSRRINIQKRF